jgi:hypothetical protein
VSYESRAYDTKPLGDGFPPEPVVVLVVSGQHDVSRLVWLLNGGTPVMEQYELGKRLNRQLSAHSAGTAALKLLHEHGGPDFGTPNLVDTARAVAARNPHDGRTRTAFEVGTDVVS